MKNNYKLFLDIKFAMLLDQTMGREIFIDFLEKHLVIAVDKECYKFLISIQTVK